MLDAHGSGDIDSEKLKVATSALGFEPEKGEAQRIIADVDDERNATIGRAELLKTMTHEILNCDPKDGSMKAFRIVDDECKKRRKRAC